MIPETREAEPTKPQRGIKKWIYENIMTGKIVYSKKIAHEIGFDSWEWDIIGEIVDGEIYFY